MLIEKYLQQSQVFSHTLYTMTQCVDIAMKKLLETLAFSKIYNVVHLYPEFMVYDNIYEFYRNSYDIPDEPFWMSKESDL